MKIEMGESLICSWLKHVKNCQIVQTNWKVSSTWRGTFAAEEELDRVFDSINRYYTDKGLNIFKKTTNVVQLIKQGECDAIGTSIRGDKTKVYAVDVAFHGNGLNYGTAKETEAKIICKCTRTALCLRKYFGVKDAIIVFASPKVLPSMSKLLSDDIEELQEQFDKLEYNYKFKLIINEDFKDQILSKALYKSGDIEDTSELFLRSVKMLELFDLQPRVILQNDIAALKRDDSELKIGKLAQKYIRGYIENGAVTNEEIELLQNTEYSKKVFDLNYPLLVKAGTEYDDERYYIEPIVREGVTYYICSQWYDNSKHSDRPFLQKWIDDHR